MADSQYAFDFAGDFVAVALGDFGFVELDAGLRVGVGAAAHRDEGDGIGILVFELFGGVAGPVAADLEVGEDDAVAGVVDPDAADFAVEIDDGHHGQIVVDGAAFGAAVDREADVADAVGEARRLHVAECVEGCLLDFVDELLWCSYRFVLAGRAERVGRRAWASAFDTIGAVWQCVEQMAMWSLGIFFFALRR